MRKRKYLSAVIVLAALVLVGYLLAGSSRQQQAGPIKQSQKAQSNETTTPSGVPSLVIGSSKAKLTVVEYGDFKCPLCNKFFYQTEPQLKKEYVDTGKVRFEFRNLAVIASDSTTAGAAAYCAAAQGEFEVYHNALFRAIGDEYYQKGNTSIEYKVYFTNPKLKKLADDVGLNRTKFDSCVDTRQYESAVQTSTDQAKARGIASTPTFVIGNQTIQGAQPYNVVKAVIESELRR